MKQTITRIHYIKADGQGNTIDCVDCKFIADGQVRLCSTHAKDEEVVRGIQRVEEIE